MTTRKDKLQRLQVASPCSSSWEAMHGDGRRRRCLECDKPVYDFAQLTPREIAGVIEASQGELCARLTRDDWGRLVTLQPPITADPLASRRASPLVPRVREVVYSLDRVAVDRSAVRGGRIGGRHTRRPPRRLTADNGRSGHLVGTEHAVGIRLNGTRDAGAPHPRRPHRWLPARTKG